MNLHSPCVECQRRVSIRYEHRGYGIGPCCIRCMEGHGFDVTRVSPPGITA